MKRSIFAIVFIFAILLFPPVLNNKAFAAEGDISDAVIDTLTFEATDVDVPKLIKVDDDTFAVVYEGADEDLFLETFDVSASGIISQTGTHETGLELDNSNGGIPTNLRKSWLARLQLPFSLSY